jgi:peptide/nickel transport system substrate-binding protein
VSTRTTRKRATAKAAALALAALSVAAVLAGCASSTPASSTLTHLTVGLSQNPDTLDPGASGLVGAGRVDAQIFDPLVYQTSTESTWTPGLATNVTVNSNATVYTFTLRHGVKFQDGTPFNAAAVKATFDHIVDPATKSVSAAAYLSDYTGTTVTGDYTAAIHFSDPKPSFAQEMTTSTFGIDSPTALKKWGTNYGQHPVGTGPFSFKSWTNNSEVQLVRNSSYTWGPKFYGSGPSKIKSITFRVLSDATAQNNALSTGEIQVADSLTPQDAKAAQGSGKTVDSVVQPGMPYGYALNFDKAPTSDLAVRQAVIHAVNRKSIVKTLFQGQYSLASSVVTPAIPGYVDDSKDYTYDPKLADQLLDQAGWVKGSDGMRSKNGVPLTINMLDIANFGFDGMSTLIQADLQKVGIKANISSQAWPTVVSTYNKGTQNTASWFFGDDDPALVKTMFDCDQVKAGYNLSHFCDPALDTQMNAADTTPAAADRATAFTSVFTKLDGDALYIPMYNLQVSLVTNKIKGIVFTSSGAPLYATAH